MSLNENEKLEKAQQAHETTFTKEKASWFDDLCAQYRPLWEKVIAEEIAKRTNGADPAPTADEYEAIKADVAKRIADQAEREETAREAKLTSLLVRTSIIVAAATLLLAAFAFRPTIQVVALVSAFTLTVIGFVAALKPMALPIRKAFKEDYVDTAIWSLLVTDDFSRWMMASYKTDGRNPVISRYDRAHAIAVRALILATIIVAVGVAIGSV